MIFVLDVIAALFVVAVLLALLVGAFCERPAKQSGEELRAEIEQLTADLATARGEAATHLYNLEQVAERDLVIRELTEQRDTAIAAVEAMAAEDQAAGLAS